MALRTERKPKPREFRHGNKLPHWKLPLQLMMGGIICDVKQQGLKIKLAKGRTISEAAAQPSLHFSLLSESILPF